MHRTELASTAAHRSEPDRLAYSVPQAAKVIGISPRRVWDLVRLRKIRSYTEGTRRLISRNALEEYVAQREAEAAQNEVA